MKARWQNWHLKKLKTRWAHLYVTLKHTELSWLAYIAHAESWKLRMTVWSCCKCNIWLLPCAILQSTSFMQLYKSRQIALHFAFWTLCDCQKSYAACLADLYTMQTTACDGCWLGQFWGMKLNCLTFMAEHHTLWLWCWEQAGLARQDLGCAHLALVWRFVIYDVFCVRLF